MTHRPPMGKSKNRFHILTLSGPRILHILLKHCFVRAPKNIIREDLPKERKASSPPKDTFSMQESGQFRFLSLALSASCLSLHFLAGNTTRMSYFVTFLFLGPQKQSRCVLSMEELSVMLSAC